jgi:hypothetical protein
MPEVPSTGLACPVQVWQWGLAMHMVQTSIHDASDQPFKGMDLGLAAPDAGVRHGSLLYGRDTVPHSFLSWIILFYNQEHYIFINQA